MVNVKKHDLRLYYEDRLVARWQRKDWTIVSQGKRVTATCPLTKAERRIYVEKGLVACIGAVMKMRQCSLTEARALVFNAR